MTITSLQYHYNKNAVVFVLVSGGKHTFQWRRLKSDILHDISAELHQQAGLSIGPYVCSFNWAVSYKFLCKDAVVFYANYCDSVAMKSMLY